MMTQVKTASEIAAMRRSGKILASVLASLQKQVRPGISTKELADCAARELKKLGGKPAFLGYQGFPDVLCISVNNEVVHGIPRADRYIEDGDVVSLDFGVVYDGMITDAAISIIAGKGDTKKQRLLDTTKKALDAGINVVKDGVAVGDIAAAVQAVLDNGNYGIVRDLVGHGVGHELHEEPSIPNYGSRGRGPHLKAGMTIAIEPMATLGDYRVYIKDDGWTVQTWDNSLAGHFEHTVLVTKKGADILTKL